MSFRKDYFLFRLSEQHGTLLNQNQELEDRLLNVVDKIERDKSLLSDEIDHLAEKLACATNTIDYMKNECVSFFFFVELIGLGRDVYNRMVRGPHF